jgi:hypothetical protein
MWLNLPQSGPEVILSLTGWASQGDAAHKVGDAMKFRFFVASPAGAGIHAADAKAKRAPAFAGMTAMEGFRGSHDP